MRARELMRAAGRAIGCRGAIGAALLAGGATHAVAGPEGEDVVSGWAEFYRDGVFTYIYVSDMAIIQYDAFNIESWETVRFLQPSEFSRVLNRIDSAMPTFINGTLEANGQVFFVNPAGIYFGGGAVVDVGGIYAAAGHVSDADFAAGINNFTGLQGEVVNHGTIRSSGSVAMLGRRVANFGQVIADDVVTMAAGDEVLIGERDGHVFARVTGSGLNTGGPATQMGVENAGTIRSGGQVILGVGDHFALALFDTSEIYAQAVDIHGRNGSHISVAGKIDVTGETGGRVHVLGDYIEIDNATIDASGELGGGTIRIGGDYQGDGYLWRAKATWIGQNALLRADAITQGDGGAIVVWADGATGFAGTISAKGGLLGGDGGFAEVSGKGWLSFNGGVDLTAAFGDKGTLLLDPTNIRIFDGPAGSGDVDSSATNADFIFGAADADPGDMETSIANADIVTLLDTTDLILQANNDILIEGSIDASGNAGDHSLSLNAGRSVVISDNVSIFLRGAFTATVNDIMANADRGVGAGAFTMGANSVINTTFGAADGAITVTSQDGRTGAELAGDFTLGTLNAGTGAIYLTVEGDDGSASFLSAAGGASLTGGLVELNNAMVGGDLGSGASALSISTPLFAAATSGDAFLSFSGATTIGAIDSTTGVSSTGGSVSIVSDSLLTLDESVSIATDNESITLDVADLDIDVVGGALVTTNGGTGRSIIITGGGGTIDMASGLGTGLVLSAKEIRALLAPTLQFGDGSTTLLSVGDVVLTDYTGADVVMRATGAGGAIDFTPSGATTLEFVSLDAQSAGGITFGANVSGIHASAGGTLTLDAGAGGILLPGGVFTLGMAGTTTTLASGVTSATGALTLEGMVGIDNIAAPSLSIITVLGTTINGTLDANGADLTLVAGGLLDVTGMLVTDGGALALLAGDLSIAGSINAGAGGVSITSTNGIELGVASGGGGVMVIDNTELSKISGGSLTIGSGITPSIRVEGVDGAALGGDVLAGFGTGAIMLVGDVVTFEGAASVFSNLEVTAATSSTISVNLTTETGGMVFTSPDLSIGGGLMVTSAGELMMGDVTLTGVGGTVTLASGGGMGVTMGGVTSTMGSGLTVNSAAGISAGAIDLGAGALVANVDQGADDSTTSDFDAITAASVSVVAANAATLNFNGLITTTAGGVTLDALAGGDINITSGGIDATGGAIDLTAMTTAIAAGLTANTHGISVTGDLSIGQGLTLNAMGGAIGVTGGVSLTGAGGTVTLTSADTFGITTGSITSTMDSSLTINSGDAVTLGAIDLGAGALLANIDQGAAGATTSSFGSVAAGSVSILAANDATLDFGGLISSTAGVVTINSGAGGAININAGGIDAAGGAVTLTGSTTLLADIVSAGESVTFVGDLTLGGAGARSITITGGGAGDLIDMQGGLFALAGQGLTLNAGTGSVNFGDASGDGVGQGGMALGDVLVSNATTVTINAGLFTAESFSAGVGGTVGTVDFGEATGLVTLTGANGSGHALEIDAATLITLAHAVNSTGAGATVMLSGPVNLNNDLATNSGSITFVNDVTLGGAGTRLVTINSGNAGDTIDFRGNLDAAAGENLTLNAGTGDVTIGDSMAVDVHGGVGALGDVLVTDAGLVTINGSMTANSLSIGVGGTVGTATLNVGTTTLTLLGASGGGYAVFIDAGTQITLNGNIDSQGAGAHVSFDGPTTLGGDIQINAADLGFNGDVLLSGGGTLLLTILNAGVSDSILFAGNLDANAGENLTFDVGIGAITLGDAGTDQIGFAGELGDVLVLNAGAVDVNGAMKAESFTAGTMGTVGSVIFANGPGTLVSTFSGQNAAGYALQLDVTNSLALSQAIRATSMAAGGGAIDANAGAGMITSMGDFDIESTGSLILRSAVMSGGDILVTLDTGSLGGMTGAFEGLDGGDISVSSGGGALALTFNGAIVSDGVAGVELDAMSGGSLLFNAGSSITTTGGAIAGDGSVDLTGAVTLATDLTIDTSAAGASGGDITINNAVNADVAGTRALDLQAGDGVVTVASIGDLNRLDSLTIDAGGGTINFRGLTYAAEGQSYAANLFSVDTLSAPASVLFTGHASQAGDIVFMGGTMALASMHDVTFNAPNGSITLVPITGGPSNSIFLTTSGTATLGGLGTALNPFNEIQITATEINLGGMIFGVGPLSLRPFGAGQAIEVGGLADSGGGVLDLTMGDLAMLGDGFASILIGRSDGTGLMGIHGFTFLDSVSLATSGNILIDGLLATSTAGDTITLGDSVAQSSVITLDVGGATITTNNGGITAYGSLSLAQSSTISTGAGAGSLMVTGVTDAVDAGVQGLTVNTGTGAIDLGRIGGTTTLASLSLSGGDIFLDGIGTSVLQGVNGLVDVTSAGLVTLGGVDYRAGEQMWSSAGGFLAASDLDFTVFTGTGLTIGGGDFTLAGNSFNALTAGQNVSITSAFVGSGAIGETFVVDSNGGVVSLADLGSSGGRLASVEVRGTTVALNDVYTLMQAGATGDQTFVGELTLASTYDSMGGDILFDGNVTGLSTVVANAAGGTMTFTGTNLTAPSWDLMAAFYDFTGSPSVFMEATAGNIAFMGGQIRLLGPSDITFEAISGVSDIILANILGNGTEDLIATATGTIFTNGAGTSAGTGVDTTTLTAEEIELSGAGFWSNIVSLIPYMAGTDVNVAMGTSGTSLDLTAAELNSLMGLDELYIGRLDGTGLMSVGALTLSSYLELQMQGAGGQIEVYGPLSILGGDSVYFRSFDPMLLAGSVTTQGGDFTSDTTVEVSGTASITTGGGDVNVAGHFDGLSDGDGDLTISYGSGAVNFTAGTYGYGSTKRLSSLHLIGDAITLQLARTQGSQTYSGVTTLDSTFGTALADAVNGGITFENDVYVWGDSLVMMGGANQTTFMGDVFGMNTGADVLRINAGPAGFVRFEGGVGTAAKELESLFIDDAVSTTFLGDVYAADQLDITGTAILDASGDADSVLVFCGTDVTFNNALVSSVQGASGIQVMATGLTTFGGPVGDGAGRLRSLVTDSPGTTLITSDISTQLGMTFSDDVLIGGTPTLRTYDTGGAGSIFFLKTVNADGVPGRTLTVLTDLSGVGVLDGALNSNVPIIHFVGDIGTAVGGMLAELNLNYSLSLGIDGHTGVPVYATIVLGDAAAFLGSGVTRDFMLNVGSLNMGRHEKIGVTGALTLNALVSARLGDITAAGDMFVTTPSLTILLRDPGQVFDPTTFMLAFDDGVDFISGGTQIVFTTGSITLDGVGDDPSFAVSGGNVTVSEPFEIRSFSEQVSALMAGLIVLDVRSLGPTNTNVAEAIAGAVPRESQSGTISQDTTVGLAAQEVLRELGIYPRASLTDPRLTDAERTALLEAVLEAMLGMAVYNDLPGDTESEITEVTVDRLELELVEDILADYRALFRGEGVDPETGETVVVDRRSHIRDTLSEAVILYFETLETDTFDPDEFMAFLEDQGEQTAEALGYVRELRRLFGRIRLLGLSSREVAGVKSALFGAVRPGDLTTTQIEALIDPSTQAPVE